MIQLYIVCLLDVYIFSAPHTIHVTIKIILTRIERLPMILRIMMIMKILIDLIKRSGCQIGILREQQTMCQLKMALFGTACPSNMDFMTTVKVILEQRDTQF